MKIIHGNTRSEVLHVASNRVSRAESVEQENRISNTTGAQPDFPQEEKKKKRGVKKEDNIMTPLPSISSNQHSKMNVAISTAAVAAQQHVAAIGTTATAQYHNR